jgi:tetratricopeptide (TPR) repeat protein
MRFLAVLLAVWAVVGLVASAPAVAATAVDAILAQANAALAGGQYATAQTFATAGLAEPGLDDLAKSRLLVARGLAHQAQDAVDEALVDFTVALQGDGLRNEERARVLFARGLTLDGEGRLEAAIGDYSAALQVSPRAGYALNNRANIYRRQGRFADARHDYTAALEAHTPNPQYPYYGLGQIAEAEGDLASARDFYSRALTADPSFQLARERMAIIGVPAESAADLPTDNGVIVLKPPGVRAADAALLLRPPPAPHGIAPLPSGKPAVPPMLVAQTPRRREAAAAPGRGAPLRPAIVDTAGAQGGLVQLGAWRSEAEVRAGWAVAQAEADGLLDDLKPVIVMATLPGRGTFYRLRVPAHGAASQFCETLQAKGLACMPVRD